MARTPRIEGRDARSPPGPGAGRDARAVRKAARSFHGREGSPAIRVAAGAAAAEGQASSSCGAERWGQSTFLGATSTISVCRTSNADHIAPDFF